jgi:hypothetical protein
MFNIITNFYNNKILLLKSKQLLWIYFSNDAFSQIVYSYLFLIMIQLFTKTRKTNVNFVLLINQLKL